MPENKQMTHSQHFISKMYLRQFSANKKNLYRYDVNDLVLTILKIDLEGLKQRQVRLLKQSKRKRRMINA